MSVTRLRHADRPATPWKNGGGVTREIAAWPPGAPLTDFDWRISLATVAEAGPFSAFPGVDRVLSVVEGQLVMAIADGPARALTIASDPLAFAGEAAVWADVPGGPAMDVNVMTRRGRVAAEVARRSVSGACPCGGQGWAAVVACEAADVRVDDRSERLERFDALLLDMRQTPHRLIFTTKTHIILANLTVL